MKKDGYYNQVEYIVVRYLRPADDWWQPGAAAILGEHGVVRGGAVVEDELISLSRTLCPGA